ncbi:hypothetical protein L873DRAFT_1257624 [Choiromyces venosus 120613-1]|uniref:PiggyBac transposable element-derived protein domain-containing protein n=1 Tax=Choiromyces venosus 120613-1 TaxID=1336337 RepID=A0A3N4JHP7_9PEZI|nr:hypothetical protein L873DRAFT_1257624 [Choiromyces venosus 120613-1]
MSNTIMDDLNNGYESEEEEVEFCGRGRDLGQIAATEITNNEENADHENNEDEYQEYQEQEVGDEDGEGDEVEGGRVQNRQGQAQINRLPLVPAFEPYEHPKLPHKRTLSLPVEFSGRFDAVQNPEPHIAQHPIDFFTLFFDEEVFANLARNTNAYATVKWSGQGGSRRWQAAQGREIMIFLGLIIYMGLYHTSTVPDYWRKDGLAPLHR